MMSAAERLRETQRAAGHRNLNAWHDVLIKEGKTFKNVQSVRSPRAEPLSVLQEALPLLIVHTTVPMCRNSNASLRN